MTDVPKEMTLSSRVARLRACLRELWKANDIDLHMCDGSLKSGQYGLLRDIREDVGHLLSERERRTAQGVTVPEGWQLYAWASSKPYRLNHLMSAAQYTNALPKNRVDFDIPLYGPAAPSLPTSAGDDSRG
jgi:hypothetical protein